MPKFMREVAAEKRKVRWSSSKKSTYVFFATLITITIFIVIIALFSWGVGAIIGLA